MSAPRVVVTGASRFVGRHLIDHLQDDYRIVGIARRSQRRAGIADDPNVTWLEPTSPNARSSTRLRSDAGDVRGALAETSEFPIGECRLPIGYHQLRYVMSHPTVYVVPTDRWYIERAVWLIAGCVLLASTTLAWLVDPRFIVFVAITGLTSVSVAFTGFCPVGNILYRFGLRGLLADSSRPASYFMATDCWYLERRIYITVGINITLGSLLSLLWSPWWLAFTGFVGVAMVWFAGTGFCILANFLYWIGCEPRLVPQAHTCAPRASI